MGMGALGKSLAAISKWTSATFGERLLVTRIPNAGQAAIAAFPVSFLAQPLTAEDSASLQLEGKFNASNDDGMDFVAQGAANVRIDDRIAYDNGVWLVIRVTKDRTQGVTKSLHCYAKRDG